MKTAYLFLLCAGLGSTTFLMGLLIGARHATSNSVPPSFNTVTRAPSEIQSSPTYIPPEKIDYSKYPVAPHSVCETTGAIKDHGRIPPVAMQKACDDEINHDMEQTFCFAAGGKRGSDGECHASWFHPRYAKVTVPDQK